MNKSLMILIIIMGSLVGGGCATLGVQPWERELLASEAMQVEPNPVQAAYDDHIYFSVEGSSGGRSFGGGGCGCN